MEIQMYTGSNYFRQRLVLSLLSGKRIKIKNIRDSSDEPGINVSEESFLKLIDLITDGSTININETGTSVKFTPGLLLGGKLQHDCNITKCIGYYLEPLLILAPFCKKPLQITLRGITNNEEGPSVDAIKATSLPILKRIIIKDENLDLKITSRGMPPEGGGEVFFSCPIVNNIRPVKLLDQGKIKRIRGTAYSARVSPAMSSRMVDTSKGLLLKKLSIPDVYIHTDHYKGKNSGRSPGFGLTLVAETTTGVFYCGESISNPAGSGEEFITPEDLAKQAVHNLIEEIYRGGCIDSRNQSLAFVLMALSTVDVSKAKTGPLSSYSMRFLKHIDDFLQVRMKLEADEGNNLNMGAQKVLVTCVGTGYTNISRMIQ